MASRPHPQLTVHNQTLDEALFDLGGAALMEVLEPWGEPIFPCMQGYPLAAAAGEGRIGPTKLRQMILKRNELQKAYLDRWNATATDGKPRMDGIICATSPWAAPRLGQTQRQSFYIGYTSFVNILGKQHLITLGEIRSHVYQTSAGAPFRSRLQTRHSTRPEISGPSPP